MNKIYKFHLKRKTTPSDFIKHLPRMNVKKLHQTFFLYYTDWHRLYCKDNICRAPEVLSYCSSYSSTPQDFMKNLFYFTNSLKLFVNNKKFK